MRRNTFNLAVDELARALLGLRKPELLDVWIQSRAVELTNERCEEFPTETVYRGASAETRTTPVRSPSAEGFRRAPTLSPGAPP
jgi:hypothetical protein